MTVNSIECIYAWNGWLDHSTEFSLNGSIRGKEIENDMLRILENRKITGKNYYIENSFEFLMLPCVVFVIAFGNSLPIFEFFNGKFSQDWHGFNVLLLNYD